ncbi:unnamed protein product [Rodentolepis nana]|uniref:Uncharacterized protein n=1 Tax=Rodentolepis nana TaxID=102285 RepID=A0A0R3TYN9_RODNA|nr:unnamed protein product [Rodentolepis nana]
MASILGQSDDDENLNDVNRSVKFLEEEIISMDESGEMLVKVGDNEHLKRKPRKYFRGLRRRWSEVTVLSSRWRSEVPFIKNSGVDSIRFNAEQQNEGFGDDIRYQLGLLDFTALL